MTSIEKDVILIHVGTHASIPANWTRETTLDGLFPKGWDDSNAPDITGGNATHTHTSGTHAHSITSHTHTGTTGQHDSGTTTTDGGSNSSPDGPHTHTFTSGGISGNSGNSTTITWSSPSNNPPYRKVIFIKAGIGAQLLDDIVALWGESDTAPTNWSKVTELANRYLLGASTGDDADLTTDGGSSTQTHTSTHTHSISHTHTGTTDVDGAGKNVDPSGGNGGTLYSHTHSITLYNPSETSNTYNATSDSQSNEPYYRRLHAIKKGAGGLKEKKIIGLYLGDPAHPPRGWVLYTAMKGFHIKVGDPTTSATGGSNTHSHGVTSHTHNASSAHTHTGTATVNYSAGNFTGSGGPNAIKEHTHPISTTQSQTTSLDSGDIPATSTDNQEPEYRTVAFIQFQHSGFSPLMMGQL